MRKLAAATFSLCAMLLLSGSLLAQNPLGRIVGTVVDQTGAVVPGATVTVTNEGTGLQQTFSTTGEGAFIFAQLQPGNYSVRIEATGFKSRSYTQAKVDPGQDYSISVIMEVGETSETVTIEAGADIVNTSSPEVNNTVAKRQIIDLPLNGRNPIELIRLQAGVPGITNRTTTAINGGRPTWTQVTQDGINIQDNFIRTNSLDFVPNRPTADTIGEFTITTTNQGADSAGGSSQVKLITPSGTNQFHGTLYEFNRNSALAANSWFNNAARPRSVARPFLNRNQFGGNVSGPVFKNKLFFFGSYEGFRQATATTQNNTIPVNDNFFNGEFRYIRPTDNSIQSINVLQLVGLTVDPRIKSIILDQTPRASNVNNFDVGNSGTGRLLNTAGYRFNQQDLNNRDQFQGRLDYNMTSNHKFEGSFQWFKETDDRTDLDAINPRPLVFTESTVKFVSGAWRWSTAKFQNELRMGANLAPVAFNSSADVGGAILSVPFITNRQVTFQPQGRDTRTRQFINNASLILGNHSMQFGGSLQQIRVRPYNFAGQFPTIGFGFSPAAPTSIQLNANLFPQDPNNPTGQRIQPADLTGANNLVAFLNGVISSVSQTFQVRNQTSGFVPGIPEERNLSLNNLSFYFQDNWRLRSNLTVRYGLKWEYFSPMREDNNLGLLPVINGDVRSTLLTPNTTVDFLKGNPYNPDRNNFGPTFGLAWDPFKDGKTSVRGGYTMAFVNEETLTVVRNAINTNAGLATTSALVNQFARLAQGIPQPTATFRVPRTFADQLALSPTSATATIDPNIRQPYIHQITFGISRELDGWFRDFAVEARYVSTLGRDLWRGQDFNQTNAGTNQAFLDDFRRARSNGFLALASTGAFNPNFNASIAGSQQLTFLPNIGAAGATAGLLNNVTVRNLIQQGQPAGLADLYVANRIGGSAAAFLPNPGIYAANITSNGATTDYHSFQFEVRRRLRNGIFGQFNYTFSKALANSAGTSQARFEPFLDNARPELERTRADFDVTHIINSNVLYELPFGRGKKFFGGANRALDAIIGGWQLSTIVRWQSGSPISILSQRATFNRGGRSAGNPATSTLTKEQISGLFGIRKLPNGQVFYIDPAVTDTATGRAVGADNLNNTPAFTGQVFFNPLNEQIGQLQRLQFDGPSVFGNDLSIFKRFTVTERIRAELRGDLFNFMNTPVFFFGDQSINSALFGRATSTFAPRVVQISARLTF
ncbi:MAG: carboxypeptidase regulatory-like domain-containing protein [Blastocatellia bacterium]